MVAGDGNMAGHQYGTKLSELTVVVAGRPSASTILNVFPGRWNPRCPLAVKSGDGRLDAAAETPPQALGSAPVQRSGLPLAQVLVAAGQAAVPAEAEKEVNQEGIPFPAAG